MTTVIAFFNNKGGVGKTTLAFHLAHMVARLGVPTLAVDLDPQAILTAAFYDSDELETLWPESRAPVDPLTRTDDVAVVAARQVAERLFLLPGDLRLSRFDDRLSSMWSRAGEGDELALRDVTAFHRLIQAAAGVTGAQVAFVDLGPNLGAMNRSALLTADHVLVPLAPDLVSVRGLANLGPALRRWRYDWQTSLLPIAEQIGLEVPREVMSPLGYVVLLHAVRLDRRARSAERWLSQIPGAYSRSVLEEESDRDSPETDPHCLATLRNYRSLIPLAQDARKPMFDLRAADGALGSTARLVQACESEFRRLATTVLDRAGVALPDDP